MIRDYEGFGFVDTSTALSLTLVVGLSLFLLLRAERRTVQAHIAFRLKKDSRTRWNTLISILVLFLLAIASGRPYWGYRDVIVERRGEDIVLLIDISKSMLARDVSPHRFGLAIRKAEDLVDEIEQRGSHNRIGLVVFSGEPQVLSPLTLDLGVIKAFLKSLSPMMLSPTGSRIDRAIEEALDVFSGTRRGQHIILLTDGEDENLDSSPLTELLRRQRAKVHSLGIGSLEGSRIEDEQGNLLRKPSGEPVVTKARPEILRALAEATGGIFQTGTVHRGDIGTLLDEVELTSHLGRGAGGRTYNEIGWLLLMLCLLCMTVGVFFRLRLILFSLMFFFSISHSPPVVWAESPVETLLQEGQIAYEQGDFLVAVKRFEKALFERQRDPDIAQALGSALFRLKRTEDAIQAFRVAISAAKEPRRRFESLYNRGNCSYALERFTDAVKDYEEALGIEPNDVETIFNLELARKRLLTPTPTSSAQGGTRTPNTPTPINTALPSPTITPSPTQLATPSPDTTVPATPTYQPNTSPSATPTQSSVDPDDEEGMAPTPTSLPNEEIQRWFRALPEAPLLLRMKRDDPNENGGQAW